MNNHPRWITGVVLLALCAVASSSQKTKDVASEGASKVPFCEVLSHFKDYDEKTVVTTSLVGASFHSIALFDPACMSAGKENRSTEFALPDSWNSTELGKKLEKVFRHHDTAKIIFEGVFHSSKWAYGGDGARFRFTMKRLISVEKVSKKEAMPAAQQKSNTSLHHEAGHAEGIIGSCGAEQRQPAGVEGVPANSRLERCRGRKLKDFPFWVGIWARKTGRSGCFSNWQSSTFTAILRLASGCISSLLPICDRVGLCYSPRTIPLPHRFHAGVV